MILRAFQYFFSFKKICLETGLIEKQLLTFLQCAEKKSPKLQKDSYSTLIDEATTEFDLDSLRTYIIDFRCAYPEYVSKIDAATSPIIRPDCDISQATLGYNVLVRYRQ